MSKEKAPLIEHNTAVLANTIELVTLTLSQILGKEVSRMVGGNSLNDDAVTSLVAARMKNKLAL